MALRKGKIIEAAGEKEEILGIAFRYLEIPLCPSAIPTPLTFQLNLVPFCIGIEGIRNIWFLGVASWQKSGKAESYKMRVTK
ncbi:hypothetical protein ACWATR_06210 [Nostoc sp. UIC 10890]|jgi:hypothetical protein